MIHRCKISLFLIVFISSRCPYLYKEIMPIGEMNMSTCRSAYNQSVPILCQRSAQTFKVFHPQVQICQIPTVPHLEEEYLEISMGQQVVGPLHLCPHIIMPICRSIRTPFPLQEMMTKDILANSIGMYF